MRGLFGYFSRSRLSSGTARAYSFFASSVWALSVSSAMSGRIVWRARSVADALQLEPGGRGRSGVRVALDRVVERLPRHREIAGALECESHLEHRVGR